MKLLRKIPGHSTKGCIKHRSQGLNHADGTKVSEIIHSSSIIKLVPGSGLGSYRENLDHSEW
jgi:hypothetical protein